jgi:hypothetical protein
MLNLLFRCDFFTHKQLFQSLQIEVNADGTKTMKTGGTKTIYSWDTDKGEITQKTETVKSHSEVLRNPLVNLNEEIQRLELYR